MESQEIYSKGGEEEGDREASGGAFNGQLAQQLQEQEMTYGRGSSPPWPFLSSRGVLGGMREGRNFFESSSVPL